MVIWDDEMAFLDPPAIVCRAWHPARSGIPKSQRCVPLAFHARGLVRCECFSRNAPEGDIGHRPEGQLYPIARSDFDRALELLQEQDLETYEEHATERSCAR